MSGADARSSRRRTEGGTAGGLRFEFAPERILGEAGDAMMQSTSAFVGGFVGRAAELEALLEHQSAAERGSGRIVTIRGASGIGKAWLAGELGIGLADRGVTDGRHRARCRADPQRRSSGLWLGARDAE